MLASGFQRVFGVIRHVDFTFKQICGGTVCNLRFLYVLVVKFKFKFKQKLSLCLSLQKLSLSLSKS